MLRIRFHSHTGLRHSLVCMPSCLEYSAKDGKFRVLSFGPVLEIVAPTDFIALAKERLARQYLLLAEIAKRKKCVEESDESPAEAVCAQVSGRWAEISQ